MSKRMKTLITLSVLTLLVAYRLPLTTDVHAVEIHPNAGTTSATFLKLGPGSRAVAMGSSFIGLADDVSALYWNPAGLAQLDGRQANFTHNESFEGIRHDFLGYAQPLSKGVIAAGLYGLYTPGDLERRSGLNEADPYEPISPVEGFFRSYDMAAHVSYARAFKENLYLGASVKFIRQTIDTASANSVAADLGALYRFRELPLSLGFTAQHMGLPVKFRDTAYALPFNLGCGAAWRWNRKLVTTFDLNKPVDNFLFVSAGTEYLPFEMLAVRAGYRYRLNGLELGDLSGLSAGLGFNVPLRGIDLGIDYAFVPFGVLGNSHRVSVSMLFANDKPAPVRTAAGRAAATPEKPAAAVPLPAAAAAVAAGEGSGEGYAHYPVAVACRPRMATSRSRIYAVSGVPEGSDLVSFDGFVRREPADLSARISERKGDGTVYKYFEVSGDAALPLRNVSCRLRLPRELVKPAVITADGKRIEPVLVTEGRNGNEYRFTLERFVPFRVESAR